MLRLCWQQLNSDDLSEKRKTNLPITTHTYTARCEARLAQNISSYSWLNIITINIYFIIYWTHVFSV